MLSVESREWLHEIGGTIGPDRGLRLGIPVPLRDKRALSSYNHVFPDPKTGQKTLPKDEWSRRDGRAAKGGPTVAAPLGRTLFALQQ